MANTLAYYHTATITAVKSFIVQAPGGVFTKPLTNFLPPIFWIGCLIDKVKGSFQVNYGLELFIIVPNIRSIAMKRSSLQKE